MSLGPENFLPKCRHEPKWNGWRQEGNELVYPLGGEDVFAFDLEQLATPIAEFNIVKQVSRKAWATDECIAGLVRALDEIGQDNFR